MKLTAIGIEYYAEIILIHLAKAFLSSCKFPPNARLTS